MNPLAIPVPQVSWKTGAAPELQQPVQVGLPAVLYPDGSALAPDNGLSTLGVFVYRLAGGGEDIWNEEEQEWQAAPAGLASLEALKPLALVPASKKNAPYPWQGTLVAAGQKDKAEADRFAAASSGAPRYRLRAFARAKRQGIEYGGLSDASTDLAFTSAEEGKRFELKLDPASIKECASVRMKLRNAALTDVAYVELRATTGNEVEIVNQTALGARLASVLLAADGSIHLKPAAGKKIVLEEDLEARQIRYLSSDGVTTKDLL